MLRAVDSRALKAYVVWLPVLEGDTEDGAGEAAAKLKDPRIRHFWNPDSSISREVAKALHITSDIEAAWDVFLIYGADARWTGRSMPAPTAWMHRLGPGPRWMRPESMLRAVRVLLPEPGAESAGKASPKRR